jgi:hypothetical protein
MRRTRTPGRAARRIIGALLAACLVGLAAGSSARAIAYIDGISDQHLATLAGLFSPEATLGVAFPGFFVSPLSGGPLSEIRLARYVTQWDVMSGAGYPEELANLRRWYDTTVALGLTPQLALANYACDGCVAPRDSDEFAVQLAALHGRFPAIVVYEPWNEPNLSGSFHIPAQLAAELMNVANAFCADHGCTAIAGDFSDASPNMNAYQREYERHLSPRDPGDWAVHLYHAVKYESPSTLEGFSALLPGGRSDRLWLTELGAYYCEFGMQRGAARQEENARFLRDVLIPIARPLHAFYYQLMWPYDETPPCESRTQDTALYARAGVGEPPLARPAASVLLRSRGSGLAGGAVARGL